MTSVFSWKDDQFCRIRINQGKDLSLRSGTHLVQCFLGKRDRAHLFAFESIKSLLKREERKSLPLCVCVCVNDDKIDLHFHQHLLDIKLMKKKKSRESEEEMIFHCFLVISLQVPDILTIVRCCFGSLIN